MSSNSKETHLGDISYLNFHIRFNSIFIELAITLLTILLIMLRFQVFRIILEDVIHILYIYITLYDLQLN